jgi:DNA-binding GntR family transcriptional regulator
MTTQTEKQRITQLIRNKIQFLELKPGQKISENTLVEELSVSRTPIREALIILCDEGLVEIFPQSGTFISKIDIALVKQLVYMRHVIETQILLDMCLHKTPVMPAVEKSLLMQQLSIKNGNQIEFMQFDDEFHFSLFELSGYPHIWRIISNTRSHHTRFRTLDLQLPQAIPSAYDEHAKIVNYIENGDKDSLASILFIHHDIELMNKKEIIAKFPEYFK